MRGYSVFVAWLMHERLRVRTFRLASDLLAPWRSQATALVLFLGFALSASVQRYAG